jgi:hypothetical protein
MMNGNTSGTGNNYFNHEYADGSNGDITTTGSSLSQAFNFPLVTPISAPRPFVLNYSGSSRLPSEWNDTAYSGQRTVLSLLESYYSSAYSGSYRASAALSMRVGSQVSYWVMNGLATQANFGSSQIAKLCVVSMVRAFMQAGNPSITVGRITPVPLLSISQPKVTDQFTDPASVTLVWSATWSRWDGQPYTEAYPSPYTNPTSIIYNLKYSSDNGKTWRYVQDGSAATSGQYDAGHSVSVTTYTWDVSAFPRGNYIVRIEGYRQGFPLHYTYQQREVYIFR